MLLRSGMQGALSTSELRSALSGGIQVDPVAQAVALIQSYSWFALYDFRDLGYADGALISSAVPDISGNGRNLTTTDSTTQPTYRATGFNGYGCAEFITDDHLAWFSGTTFSDTDGLVIYTAVRYKAPPADFARDWSIRASNGNEVLQSRRFFMTTDDIVLFGTPTALQFARPTPFLVAEQRNRAGNLYPMRYRTSSGLDLTSVNNVDRTGTTMNAITLGKNPNLTQPSNEEIAWWGVLSEAQVDTQEKRDALFDAFKTASGVA